MQESKISELIAELGPNCPCTVQGVLFCPHPVDVKKSISVVVYRVGLMDYVFGFGGPVTPDLVAAEASLDEVAPLGAIFQYVKRRIQDATLAEVKEVLEQTLKPTNSFWSGG